MARKVSNLPTSLDIFDIRQHYIRILCVLLDIGHQGIALGPPFARTWLTYCSLLPNKSRVRISPTIAALHLRQVLKYWSFKSCIHSTKQTNT